MNTLAADLARLGLLKEEKELALNSFLTAIARE